MPVLPKNLAAIRNAVASILRSGEHVGMLYSAGDIAVMLRISADADNKSDRTNTICRIATILGTRATVTSYVIDPLDRMV